MRTSTFLAIGAFCLASSLTAQTTYYIPSNTPGTGTCNVIPFGTTKTSSTWVNQRYQTIVTNAQLGGTRAPQRICALAFSPCSGNQIRSFDSLKITMAVTNATTLSTTFASNLTTNPAVVFEGKCHIWQTTQNNWSNIGLQNNYLYIPTAGANLVIEIIATGNDLKGGSGTGFHRSNTEQRVYAFSWSGTPPATGSTDQAALKMRITSGVPHIDNYGMGCGSGPLAAVGGGDAKSPGSVAITLANGPAAGGGLVWFGFSKKAFGVLPLPFDLTPLGYTGCKLQCSIDIAFPVRFASGRSNSVRIPIPQGVACLQLCGQGLAIDSTAPGGLTFSDCVRYLLGL